MLPVPFAGHLAYDVIFIITYAAWQVFEIVSGRSRKSADPRRARDRGSYWFLVSMIWVGIFLAFFFCFGVQQAAIPWMRTELFPGHRADVGGDCVSLVLHARVGALFHLSS